MDIGLAKKQFKSRELDDSIDSKIAIHDSRHFEVKLDINLVGSRSSSYEVETYFFVPRSLNVGPGNYSKHDFYSGIQKYIRFQTPQISLDRITDEGVSSSPWNRLKKEIDQLLQNPLVQENTLKLSHEIVSEIKLLGQVIRASLRSTTRGLLDEIESLKELGPTEVTQQSFCAAVRQMLKRLSDLGVEIQKFQIEVSRPQIPVRVRDAYQYFDEFFSLIVEEDISHLYQKLSKSLALRSLFDSLKDELEEVLIFQQTYREEKQYPSLIQKEGDNSIIPYRKGVLKKFTSSSLYLNLEPTEWQFLAQLNFSIAAGIAMLFAAVVTIIAQNRYSTSSSVFVIIVVVSYILKDRMKDWVKVFLSKRMLRGVADYSTKIRDPGTQQVVGVFREAFTFLEAAKVPEAIRVRRNIDNITSIDEDGKPERVMKYEKQVKLFPKKISKFHQRRRNIKDIMRFDVSSWVKHADDPQTQTLYFDRQTKKMRLVDCSKVYHLNIVFRYQSLGAEAKMLESVERIRLILSHNGIVQLEEVR